MSVAHERIVTWRRDPVTFVREVFGVKPDAWQRDALRLVGGDTKQRRRLVAKACTGPGKTAFLAWIGWHRLLCFAAPGEHPKGAALSVTGANLKDNLWAELGKWRGQSELLKHAFTWTKERIFANDHPETWFMSARAFPQDADAESIGRSLSGLHSQFPFVLLDEIGEMSVAVGRVAEQIFTGNPTDALIAAAGNPTSTDGLLYDLCTRQRGQWDVVTITADPDDPNRTPRVSKELAKEQIEKYGRDNPWVMSTILGQFPPAAFNALLSVDEVEASMKRVVRSDAFDWVQKRLGVDVARFGDDRTVIWPRQGLISFKPDELRNADSLTVASRVALIKNGWGSEVEMIDGTGGWGSGVVDALRQAGYNPIEVNASGRAADPRYFNVRAECWFRMADWIKNGGALPNLPHVIREFTSPQYTFQGGKFRLEEKDQIKKRLGFSPDYGDALAQTFFMPDMPAQGKHRTELPMQAQPHGVDGWDYDPIEGL